MFAITAYEMNTIIVHALQLLTVYLILVSTVAHVLHATCLVDSSAIAVQNSLGPFVRVSIQTIQIYTVCKIINVTHYSNEYRCT